MKLADKFELSRGRALDEIETSIAELRDEISALKLASAGGAGASPAPTPPPIATAWSYSAREFPFFTENLYVCEDDGAAPKRWIGPEPSLDLALRLRRDLRYRIAVKVADFVIEDGHLGIETLIDGEPVEHVFEDMLITFEAPDNQPAFLRGEGLLASVRASEDYVRRPSETDLDQRTLSFSIESIEVMRADR